MKRFTVSLITLIIILAVWVTMAFSQMNKTYTIIFGWDKNIESDLAGYRAYKSPVSGQYPLGDPNQYINIPLNSLTDPNNPIYEMKDIPISLGKLFYVFTAYDDWNNESPLSNEVSFEPDVIAPQAPVGVHYTVTVTITIN